MKTPSLKPPPDITQNTPSKPSSHENAEDSQLERKIHKWKSLYRKENREESDGVTNSKFENSRNLPGLKEAHKQLSLENYKLKKAYNDIQKQLDLMKVMSWYRRAQVDKLRQNDPLNMSNVIGILKKELQYLEAVYFREKRLADMWRSEDKEKTKSPSNTWKYFKDRWSKKYNGDESSQEVCMNKRECRRETETGEDTSGSNRKEPADHGGTLDEPITVDGEPLEVMQTHFKNAVQEKRQGEHNVNAESSNTEKKRDSGTVNDIENSDIRNERDSLVWRHLRLAKSVEDEDLEAYSNNEDQKDLPLQEIPNNDDVAQASDKSSNNEQPNDVNSKVPDPTTETERNSGGLLAPLEPEWFSYEILEQDDDTIIAHENKDSVPHVLYGFFHNEFREIVSSTGDIFVMSMKTECFNLNSSFVVSVLNNSPKPIQFFALLPNGKIKQQKISEQVKVTIVELGSNDGDDREAQPLIYEATIMKNGKLKVSKQNDAVESDEQSDENQNEGSKTSVESGDGKVEKGEQNGDEFQEEYNEYFNESTKNDEEYGDGKHDVSAHKKGGSDANHETGNENKVENDEDQNSKERQEDPEQTSHANQEVPLSVLKPGESYIFDPHTGRIYRRTVSAHQYPISEYETLLTEIPKQVEQVYYRFPGNMMVEKFIIKDQVVKTNPDGTVSVGEDDQQLAENTVEKSEPLEYEEEVSNTVREILKNPWKEGYRNIMLMLYDDITGTITLIYTTLFKVKSDDVISHDTLKNGKVQTREEYVKTISYLLDGGELLRVEREDETIQVITKTAEEQTADDGSETSNKDNGNTSNENSSNSENEDEFSRNFENSQPPVTNADNFPNKKSSQSTPLEDSEETLEDGEETLEDSEETLDDSEKILEDSEETLENSEEILEDNEEKLEDSEKTLEDNGGIIEGNEESDQEECSLRLGDRDTTEYWAYTFQRGATFIRDTVERVMPTPNFREEDMEKLSISTVHNEESVSYVYCDDGSVQKSWRRIEKVSRNKASEDEDNESDYSKGLHDKWTDNDDDEYSDEQEYDDIDDHDYEHDIDDEVDTDEHDDDNESHDEEDSSEYYDANDPDDGVSHDDIDDDDTADRADDKSDSEPASNEKSKKPNVPENSNDPPSINNNEETFEKDLDKEKYEMLMSREWQNLKLSQQQFEHSKEQNLRLQQQMLEEWETMKQQQREFQENFQKPGRHAEIEGTWTDLKHQQKQFESMKKQIEQELRKSLQEEWEKLKKKQAEIENRETLLYGDDETVVRYQVAGNHKIAVEIEENSDKQQETEWEPDNDDTFIPTLQQESELSNNYHSENEQKMDYEVYNPETQWTGNMVKEDSHIDRVQSDAWEMHEEENLPHELPYIPESNEKPDVDKMQSEAWELNQEPSNEEQYVNYENLPHEIPNISSTKSSKVPGVSENIFNIVARQRQEEGFPDEMSYASSVETTTQNDNKATKEGTEHSEDTSDNGQTDFETEGTQSSLQWELQIKKLREELDRLYEAKKNQKNGLQVVTYDIEVPVPENPTQDLKTESQNMVQTQCPAKCPPGNLECSPKCPQGYATDDVSPLAPNKNKKTSKPASLREGSAKKTKQPSFPTKSDRKPKQPTRLEKGEMKVENSAFMNYIEGHSYLRQLEPEEYDHKMPALKNSPLAPKRKTKRNKKNQAKPTNENDYKSKSNESNRKKRKQERHWKNAQETESNEPFQKENKQYQKFKSDYPLRPNREQKNARKNKNPTEEKSMQKAQ